MNGGKKDIKIITREVENICQGPVQAHPVARLHNILEPNYCNGISTITDLPLHRSWVHPILLIDDFPELPSCGRFV